MGKTTLACLLPLAAARAGLVHVPINPLLRRAQAAHILADSGARLLIANQARLDSLEPATAPSAELIALEDWRDRRPALAALARTIPTSSPPCSTPPARPAGPRG